MEKIMICGYGQIGRSIYELYTDYDAYELGYVDLNCGENTNMKKVDVLHICIPFNKKFIENSKNYIKKYKPRLTIINSTVPILTTSVISLATGKAYIVHSPCMGRHPNLTKSFRIFTKIIASYKKRAVKKARKHFEKIGIETITYNSPEETELAKLLDTTYYATWKISFDNVYTNTNKIYNEGYAKLGDTQFIRPTLKYMGKGIGGHCLYENAKILNREQMLKKLTRLIISLGKAK
jgi:UDP-N-acetyl-D-mannosaminuronate dehydrogenase